MKTIKILSLAEIMPPQLTGSLLQLEDIDNNENRKCISIIPVCKVLCWRSPLGRLRARYKLAWSRKTPSSNCSREIMPSVNIFL